MDLLRCLNDGNSSRRWSGECNLARVSPRTGAAEVVIDVGDDQGQKTRSVSWPASRAARATPRILVLSHADKDHVGGFREFAEEIDVQVQKGYQPPAEIWVPCSWGDVAVAIAIFQHPSFPANYYWGDAAVQDSERTNNGLLGLAAQRIDRRALAEQLSEEIVGASDEWERLRKSLRDQDIAHGRVSRCRDVDQSIDHADRIIGVLQQAEQWGSAVRYFDVALANRHPGLPNNIPANTEGEPGVVTIVNAREVRPDDGISLRRRFRSAVVQRNRPGPLRQVLALLTRANQESLVSMVWHERSPTSPVGLVWADSDGATCLNGLVPWERVKVMTAPHHASATADHNPIWTARRRYAFQSVVVSSGNQPNSKHSSGRAPRREFLAVDPVQRACTGCRMTGHGSARTSGDVTVTLVGSSAQLNRTCPAP